jgi:putative N6-adenine-specific DNA methylase
MRDIKDFLEIDGGADNFPMLAKTYYGLESVLADELTKLGASEVKQSNRAVYFEGNKEFMYKANYNLRTAINILLPIASFSAKSEDELYKKVFELEWDKLFTLKHTFALETTIHSPIFKHSQYAALKTKDAIVDKFRATTGKRPYIDTENPSILIHLHISDRECTLSFNSSGEPLFKRGYRFAASEAPLNEVLAAGIIALSGWKPTQNLIDPMCGSGTILIEAAMIANSLPPGVFRRKFGFESWPGFNEHFFNTISREDSPENNDIEKGKIIGIDISSKAINMAKSNIKNAFLHNIIEVSTCDCLEFEHHLTSGMVITNPPYGERLQKEDLEQFYSSFGDKLKKDYTGFDVWIISSNQEALKNVGLHPAKKIKMFNGALECNLNKYSIYEGSIKSRYK